MQMVMTEHQIIEVLHLERYVIETIDGAIAAEEHVVIDVGLPAITTIEGANDIVFIAGIDVFRLNEPECFAIPLGYTRHIRRGQNNVCNLFYV